MLRKCTDENISDEDFKMIIVPFNDNYDAFFENCIMSEVGTFYIANSFYRDAMWKRSFKQNYNSAGDVINSFNEDYDKGKSRVVKLLKIKYTLEIVNEEPLILKPIKN